MAEESVIIPSKSLNALDENDNNSIEEKNGDGNDSNSVSDDESDDDLNVTVIRNRKREAINSDDETEDNISQVISPVKENLENMSITDNHRSRIVSEVDSESDDDNIDNEKVKFINFHYS